MKRIRSLPAALFNADVAAEVAAVRDEISAVREELRLTTRQYLTSGGLVILIASMVFALLFTYWRDVLLFKALAVPTLIPFVHEFRRKASLAVRPSTFLGMALLLHSLGDIIIGVVGACPLHAVDFASTL
jgi:hypothetical protein